MKKLLPFLITTVAFFSCGEEPELMGYKLVRSFDIESNDWKYTGYANNNYYFCTVPFYELKGEAYHSGNVSVYLEASDGRQQPLPIVYHQEGIGTRWTTTTDFDFGLGEVTFFVTNSDFFNSATPRVNAFSCNADVVNKKTAYI